MRGLMSNLIKKSWTVSNYSAHIRHFLPPEFGGCFGAPDNSPVPQRLFDKMRMFPKKNRFGSFYLQEFVGVSFVPTPLMFVYRGQLHFLKLKKCKPKFMNQIHTLEATKNKPLSLLLFVVINID